MQRTLAFLLVCPAAFADQIVLSNGDRFTGSVVQSDGKTLMVKSDLAGTVTVALKSVVEITAKDPLYFKLKDGRVLSGEIVGNSERVEIRTAEPTLTDPNKHGYEAVAAGNITSIRSKPEYLAGERESERRRYAGLLELWSGSLDTGLSASRGNTDTTTINMNVNAVRATERAKFGVHFTSLYGRSGTVGNPLTIVDAARGGIAYNRDFDGRAFASANTDLEYDEFQKLNLRVVVAGSVGHHAIKTDRTALDVFAGGSLNKESFSTGLERRSGEILSGNEFSYKLSKSTSLHEKFVMFPNMTELGEYRMNFDTTALLALNKWLGLQVNMSDRYISNPVANLRSNDVLLTTGFHISFAH